MGSWSADVCTSQSCAAGENVAGENAKVITGQGREGNNSRGWTGLLATAHLEKFAQTSLAQKRWIQP